MSAAGYFAHSIYPILFSILIYVIFSWLSFEVEMTRPCFLVAGSIISLTRAPAPHMGTNTYINQIVIIYYN